MYDFLMPSVNLMGAGSVKETGKRCKILGGKKVLIVTDKGMVNLGIVEEVVGYIHPGNRLAAVVGFNKNLDDHQVGKEIAMQVAAMAPVAIDKEGVPKEVAEKELEIAKEKFRLEGKPEKMIERIAQGALQKFFKENTLLNQSSIRDSKITVKEYLKSIDKDLKITSFIRYALD